MVRTGKPKVAIVAGDLAQPGFLQLFEPLRREFDPVVYTLQGPALMAGRTSGLKLRVFENVCDMPGYMRGLEEELADAAVVIGLETTRLASFQALRAARKHAIPVGIIANEFLPFFYERYANIKAIQYDICQKATRFWPTSAGAADCLRLYGVPDGAMTRIALGVSQAQFRVNAAGRAKFRKYIGIQDHEVLLLVRGDLIAESRPADMLQAVALIRRQAVQRATQVRLLYAGDGPAARDLKYQASDLGLGSQVMFLHQDATPFLADMYAAADAAVSLRSSRTDTHEPPPLWLIEAMACGATPVAGAGTVAAEFADGPGIVFGGDGAAAVAGALARFLADNPLADDRRDRISRMTFERHSPETAVSGMLDDLRLLVAGAPSGTGRGLQILIEAASADVARHDFEAAEHKLEEAAALNPVSDGQKADLAALRGDVAYGRRDFEAATDFYAEGVKADSRHFGCLRGLGFVAWQGHSSEEALSFFRKALAIRDDDPLAQLGIGMTYRRLGLHEEALPWLERCAMRTDAPGSARAALTQVCAQLAEPNRGIAVLERVMEAVGEEPAFLVTLGQLYLAVGRVEQGNDLLRRALDQPS